MKKVMFVFLFLLLLFPTISAIEINMDSQFSKGQTIISSIYGDFLTPITKGNIKFYRGHVQTSFDYDVAKIGDYYYIYVQTAGKSPNNYSINISGVRYILDSQVSTQQISKVFTIKNEAADFSVSPGFIITSEDFSLRIQNTKGENIQINLGIEENPENTDGFFKFLSGGQEIGNSIVLFSGQIKYLGIQLEGITETTIRTISLSTNNLEYNIPVYIILNIPSSNQTPVNVSTNQTQINTSSNTTTPNGTQNKTCSWLEKLFGCKEEIQNTCTDTCSSLKYQCGTRTVCGISTNCGTCSSRYTCQSNGTCTRDCIPSTCPSLGNKHCGTWSNGCGGTINCGTCLNGYNCQINGTCIKSCKYTCSSLKYQCGTRTICGTSVNCGTCFPEYNCQTNGTCIKVYTNKTSANTTKNNTTDSINVSSNETEEKSTSIWDIFKKKDTASSSPEKDNVTKSLLSKTCAEIKGTVCSEGQICANKTVSTKDADCCISSCVKEEETKNKKLIGWAIIGVLFIIILWFFRIKFKGMKNKKDPLLGNKKR
ncbi:MAG: hypothetical protein ABIE36_03390 [Candidatus Diapherotrites archaeon]